MNKSLVRYVLAQRPRYGVPTPETFSLQTTELPEPGEGQLRVRTTWLSLDAHLYGRVARVSVHQEPMDLGSVMLGATVGRVEASRNVNYQEGDLVCGAWGWQSHHISNGGDIRKADSEIEEPRHHLSAFGLSAFAAYVAVSEFLGVRHGETIAFGAALGGLGQMVGQLSKLRGARVIAITSGPDKCRIATGTLGFDVALDRKDKNFREHLEAQFKKSGVDAIVMAVGPGGLRMALPHFRRGGRIGVAGLIGSYQGDGTSADSMGFLLQEINALRLSVHGIVAADHLGTELESRFRIEMKRWLKEGKIKPIEDITSGLSSAPAAYAGLFRGANVGKALVHMAD
jgi:NADPH-dependent curcumin reductase